MSLIHRSRHCKIMTKTAYLGFTVAYKLKPLHSNKSFIQAKIAILIFQSCPPSHYGLTHFATNYWYLIHWDYFGSFLFNVLTLKILTIVNVMYIHPGTFLECWLLSKWINIVILYYNCKPNKKCLLMFFADVCVCVFSCVKYSVFQTREKNVNSSL